MSQESKGTTVRGTTGIGPDSRPSEGPGRQQLMLSLMIGVGACMAWSFVIQPVEQKLVAGRAELNAASGQLADYQQLIASESPLEASTVMLREQARRTNKWTGRSGDATLLYDAIHDLADRHSVRVERVEPNISRSLKSESDKALPGSEVFGYTIEVSGGYRSVCTFINACELGLGASKVASFHISPQSTGPSTAKDPVITAIIETQHLKLVIPDVDGPTTPGTPDSTPSKGNG